MRRSVLAVTALIALAAPGHAAPPAPETVVFQGVRVFDGEALVPGARTVVIQAGRVTHVGDAVAAPAGARVVAGAGKTLMPGLIDAHAQLFAPPALETAAIFGVTTLLDMAAPGGLLKRLRGEGAGAPVRADFRSSGLPAMAPAPAPSVRPGGPGAPRGPGGPGGMVAGMPLPAITSPGDAQTFVDGRIAEGADYLKIVHDDGAAYGARRPALDRATLAALIASAHVRGKLVVVHALSAREAREALEAGADGLAHVFLDQPADAELVALAVRRKAFVVPTLSATASLCGMWPGRALIADKRLRPWLDPMALQALDSRFPPGSLKAAAYQQAASNAAALARAGVPILLGTDAPSPGTAYGASAHGELARLVEAGLTPTAALAAACAAPARAFGLGDRGRIAVGARADLLLVEGDPTADVAATRAIAGVWAAGRPVPRPLAPTPPPEED